MNKTDEILDGLVNVTLLCFGLFLFITGVVFDEWVIGAGALFVLWLYQDRTLCLLAELIEGYKNENR